MSLRSLQKSWDRLGATDPFWAILTDPAKKNNGWDPGEFFSTGEPEIAGILRHVEQLHPLPARQRALDFGCGVGRLTQPLAERFDEAYGIDISPSMLALAKKHNRHGERCRYTLNSESNLKLFPDNFFDFIYSSITLQHIEPQFTRRYLAEFIRVLRPGAVLVFQLPSKLAPGAISATRKLLQSAYYGVWRAMLPLNDPVIEMHGVDKSEVLRILEASGARMLAISADNSAGPTWESYRYMAVKTPAGA